MGWEHLVDKLELTDSQSRLSTMRAGGAALYGKPAKGGGAGAKGKGGKGGKGDGKGKVDPTKLRAPPLSSTRAWDKSDGACRHCGLPGHWNKDCSKKPLTPVIETVAPASMVVPSPAAGAGHLAQGQSDEADYLECGLAIEDVSADGIGEIFKVDGPAGTTLTAAAHMLRPIVHSTEAEHLQPNSDDEDDAEDEDDASALLQPDSSGEADDDDSDSDPDAPGAPEVIGVPMQAVSDPELSSDSSTSADARLFDFAGDDPRPAPGSVGAPSARQLDIEKRLDEHHAAAKLDAKRKRALERTRSADSAAKLDMETVARERATTLTETIALQEANVAALERQLLERQLCSSSRAPRPPLPPPPPQWPPGYGSARARSLLV